MSKIVFNSLPASRLDRQVEQDGMRAWEDGPR
jgi:hypothetical protein